MKLAVLLTAVGLQVTAGGIAQTITLSEKNVPLKTVFAKIYEQTGYEFLYNSQMLDDTRVTLTVQDATLDETLKQCFEGQSLTYVIKGKTIVVKKQETVPLNFTIVNVVHVTGKVIGVDSEPLPGVNVVEQGTTHGTVTDIDGNYTLDVADNATLIFSFVGFTAHTELVGNRTVINVILEEDVTSLNELVVNGYQTIEKERVTGSFSTITSEEIERAANNFDLKNIIEDLVPGLYFQPNQDDDPDATEEDSKSIVIRGISTFGNNNPLIVVDGFPMDPEVTNAWDVINPDDVEGITVLKDAAAASIWGAQAANGVIVITTKKGRDTASQPVFRVSLDFLTTPKPNLSNIPWANSADAVDIYEWMVLEHDWFDALGSTEYDKYELPEVMRVLVDMKANNISEADGNARLAELSKLDVRDEFSDLFLRPETKKKFNLSIQSGGQLHKVKTSITAMGENGYAKGDTDNSLSLDIQDEYSPKKWLKFSTGLNLNMRHEKNNGVNMSDLIYIPQHSRILDENGEYAPMIAETALGGHYYGLPEQARMDLVSTYNLPYDWDWNLKQDVDNRDDTDKTTNIRLYTKVAFTPIEELSIQLMYQYMGNNSLHREYYNESTWQVRNTVNYNAQTDGTFPIPKGGMLYELRSTGFAHTGRLQLSFNKTIGEHEVNFFGGTEVRQNSYEKTPSGYYGYDPQSLLFNPAVDYASYIYFKIDGNFGTPYNVPSFPAQGDNVKPTAKDNRYISYYGNLGYTFKNQYDITGSIRLDKTNLFGQAPTYRDLPQWSAGIGWTISKASFFRSLDGVVDRLRLRASYGFNGNTDRNASPYIQGYPGIDNVYDLPYATVKTAPNPELTWEKTKVVDVGVEFSLFKNRLRGSLDYYSKYTTDVLVSTEVNGSYGFDGNKATVNAGNIENTGIELSLTPTIIKTKNLTWLSTLNLGTNKNITSGYNKVPGIWIQYLEASYYYHIEGQPVSYMAAMRWAGYDEDGMPQFYYGKGENTVYSATNSPDYSDLEADSVLTYVGQTDPKVYGSLINTIKYKNFTLSFNLSYKFGHKFWSDYPSQNLPSSFASTSKYYTFLPGLMVNRWQSAADAETATMNSLNEIILDENVSTITGVMEHYSDRKALDAGQIRLQSISLSYRLPKNVLNWAKNAVVQIGARNLGAIWVANKEGIDPSNPPYSNSTWSGLNFVTRYRPEYSLGVKFGL